MRTPESINGMTREQIMEALRPIRCFMLDMDGTFYLGDQILDGSLDFLDAVERTGRSVLFLTNNSSKSAGTYVEKLRRMHVREPFLNVLTSGQAAARYCLANFAGKKAFLLVTDYNGRGMNIPVAVKGVEGAKKVTAQVLSFEKNFEPVTVKVNGGKFILSKPDAYSAAFLVTFDL